MKLTPMQRRERILYLARTDTEYCQFHSEAHSAELHFSKFTDCLPKALRISLWNYPGSLYFMHHRLLTLICQNMKFIDEE